MRAILQRSKFSKVTIDSKINGQIDKGYVVLVGFTDGDNEEIVDKMVTKIVNLRVFEDENEKMNLSILDTKGSILSISQFTLYADATKDNIVTESINLINRNNELFYDISCKVKNIDDLHKFIEDVKTIHNVSKVERVFI